MQNSRLSWKTLAAAVDKQEVGSLNRPAPVVLETNGTTAPGISHRRPVRQLRRLVAAVKVARMIQHVVLPTG
jgi:hypothetical protein